MFDLNSIPFAEIERIVSNLRRWGISVDIPTGMISYDDTTLPVVNCKSIYLIRHAETIAVSKHEFMSDTSNNCDFTNEGINTIREQALKLSQYDFDVALFGPIERVINTQKLIMKTPQKFNCICIDKLHGIDNSGWEYKSISDLEKDPVFIEREIKNNVFARTPTGTSWGTVIANCVDVIDYINKNHVGKNVLLISQGSILRAMQILLRTRNRPWDGFSVSGMYHVGNDAGKRKNYGLINKLL